MSLIGIAPAHRMDDYLECLRAAGADELMLEYGRHDPADILERVQGIVLLGGADVDPEIYGEAPHAALKRADPERDAYEIALARAAVAGDVPVLAICRGLQVLNVALGGTLVQDIPSERPSAVPHDVSDPKDHLAHAVRVAPGSMLHGLLGRHVSADGTSSVNSRHHQAAGRLGEGLIVTATAPDGVVEALERPASRFCLAVQWHPENFCGTDRFQALFDAFVLAAKRA
jgi:putative glutamine amidotransferase